MHCHFTNIKKILKYLFAEMSCEKIKSGTTFFKWIISIIFAQLIKNHSRLDEKAV